MDGPKLNRCCAGGIGPDADILSQTENLVANQCHPSDQFRLKFVPLFLLFLSATFVFRRSSSSSFPPFLLLHLVFLLLLQAVLLLHFSLSFSVFLFLLCRTFLSLSHFVFLPIFSASLRLFVSLFSLSLFLSIPHPRLLLFLFRLVNKDRAPGPEVVHLWGCVGRLPLAPAAAAVGSS